MVNITQYIQCEECSFYVFWIVQPKYTKNPLMRSAWTNFQSNYRGTELFKNKNSGTGVFSLLFKEVVFLSFR